MPPKAAKGKEVPAERPILGHFSSHLKIGIVGLPNVGKSTLFNTLTKLSVPAINFPFCTIEPNVARVYVPDERFDWLCQLFNPKSEVAAFLEISDIAGLVRGSNEGQGLGNAFLSHIQAVDGIFHVLRAFDDPEVTHVEDSVDPVRDLEIISEELRLKDIEFIERKIEDCEKVLKRSNAKEVKLELECCQKVYDWLKQEKDVRLGDWKTAEIEILNTFQLLSAKPMVYLINLTEKDYQRKKNKWLPMIHAWVQAHGGGVVIPFSGVLEQKLADMPADEAQVYCKENDLTSALPKIIKTGFAAINLIYFFTAGPDEVKCWQIRKQSKAPQAAGAIHTDFERGFICAEAMKFDELKELGSEAAVKLLSKSVGHGDRVLPSSNLVNSGTRSSSVKKTRSLKSRSPERADVVTVVPPTAASKQRGNVRTLQDSSQIIRSTKSNDVEGIKFEKFEQQLNHQELNGTVHPSLHSPMMLSTKGHAVSRESLDDLTTLRNRLSNLRATETEDDKNWGYGRNMDQNGNHGEMVMSGYGEEKEGRKGARANAADHLARSTRSNEMEKLAAVNGNMRKGDSRAGSRGRHKHQPSTMEFLSNGDVQMMYETPDDMMTTSTNSNPTSRNGTTTIHDTVEKPKRTARNRIHHHQGSGRGEDRITPMKVVSSNTNLRVPDSPGTTKSSLATIDDLNRIHQRLHQSTDVARDSPRVVENSRSGINVNLDVRDHLEDRLRQRRSNNLHSSHDVGSRVPSQRTSSMQSSGDRSPHKQQQPSLSNVNYQSSYEREEQGRQSAERERDESRSMYQIPTQISPSKQNSRLHHLSSYRSSYEGDEPQTQNSRIGHVIPQELRTRAREAGLSRKGPKPGQTWFAATELQSNLLVEVGDCRFHLHKFPLLSRSGRLNRLVFESRDTNKDHIKLPQMPGGAEAFELCVKFCYGIPVELTPQSVATLRCAAEYLEMNESLEDGNLVSKTEHYLKFVTLASWKDSIAVLQSCQRLLPWAEETQILRRCCESVAWKACTDQTGIKWSFTSTSNVPTIMWDGGKQTQLAQHIPHDWWVEDIIQLNFEAFRKVMAAITTKGMAYTLVGSAIAQYATRWIPGVEKKNRKHQQEQANRELLAMNAFTGKEIVLREGQNHTQSLDHDENQALVEGVATMLPPQQDGVSCSFLLRLLRAACVFGASTTCREELERRIGLQLEHASLSDLLIPSSNPSSPTMYDLDVVQRILEQFLLKDQIGVVSPTTTVKSDKQLHVFEKGASKPPMTPNMTKSKVAMLMDAYLAEVARDANLPLARFQNLAESLPQFSRTTDDGLYRAVDTYLKAHPTMTEHERKKLCRVMDCQRLSLEACLHAAQNERLPLRVVVQVLFSEQVKLRNAISGNTSKKTRDHDGNAHPSVRDDSQLEGQSMASRHDDSEGNGLSLRESWLATRQDIKYLKEDMERMKAKYANLENENPTQQVEKKVKSKAHSSLGWTSGWRKLSNTLKPPSLFHTSKTEFDYSHKDDASMAPTHASGDATHDSHSNFNTPRAPSDQRRRSHSVTSMSTVQRWRNSIS